MIAPSHIKALSAMGAAVRLSYVVSRSPERAKHLTKYYDGPAPHFTSDLEAVANDPSVQFVIVATPPSVRADLIRTLAQAGKHILLEKPVGRTLAEAKQVVDICEREGVTLGVLFQHRARAPSIAATQLIKEENLGPLAHVEISAPLWREQSYYDELGRGTYARDGGGVLITQAIHTIDLALSFTGPVKSVQAMTMTTDLHKMEAEDLAVAGLQFVNGAVGTLLASTAIAPQRPETVILHYAQATVTISKDQLAVSWRDGRNAPLSALPAPDDKFRWHQVLIEDFLSAISQGHLPEATGHAALTSHVLIDAIERSSRLGARINLDPT
ncbi:Gfo/Idh/MocA family oxidoreductase [Octadecabacter sp. CECT 8868]|nr:Gfo/Idh/MocA family oxidoreductase [Octadecabacter algicola]